MADALRRKNVPLAPFRPDLLRQLAPLMPPHTVPANPLCMTSQILRTPETLIKTLEALASHPVTPCLILGPLDSADLERITPTLIQASKGPNKPLFCLLADWTEQSTHFEQLSASGVILFRSPSDLAEALCLAGALNTPSPPAPPPGPRGAPDPASFRLPGGGRHRPGRLFGGVRHQPKPTRSSGLTGPGRWVE